MTCWYEQGCGLRQERCEKTCHRYLEMKYLIDNCGMPNADRYIKPLSPEKVDLNAFQRLKELKDSVCDFVNNGDNLYIVSENLGNGKTTWALKILYKYFDLIWCGNGFRPRGYFLFMPAFIDLISSFTYRTSPEGKSLIKLINNVDLVVWDDITNIQTTTNTLGTLTSYIDYRILNGKSNIFTGNYVEEDLKQIVGPRLYHRIWEGSEIVKFVGRGRREC